jgi:hypothetical protein
MSSRKCSASEFLLRMTVAMPVSVATLPIGSLEVGADESVAAAGGFVVDAGAGGFAAAGAAGVGGAGVGWAACARRMTSMVAATLEGAACASVGVGIARSLAGAISITTPISARASQSL